MIGLGCSGTQYDPNILARKYQAMLDVFGLHQMVSKPTRVTRTSKTLLDHIVTNYPRTFTFTDVIPCSTVADHDAPFACINVRIPRFKPRFKYIRNEKNLSERAFQEDFSSLPLDVVYGLDCADDMVDAMNSLIRDCIDRHAPLKRTKVTRPPAPWLQTDDIRLLQSERDHLRKQAHENGSEASWNAFREVRNKIKSVVK